MAAGGARGHGPTYVVGVDGSAPSLAAVRYTSALAREGRADLLLAQVHLPAAHASEPEVGPVPADGARRVELAASTAEEGLEALAGEEGSALVAVGAPHRYGVGRLKPGGVTERLLTCAERAVLVVGADGAGAPIRRIGVAHPEVDDDPSAIAEAAALAGALDAELEVISVVEQGGQEVTAERVHRLRSTLDRFRASDAVSRVLHGHPGPVLARAGDELDLLVVGSEATAAPGRIGLGEAARRAVAHARCPVLVVPRLAFG